MNFYIYRALVRDWLCWLHEQQSLAGFRASNWYTDDAATEAKLVKHFGDMIKLTLDTFPEQEYDIARISERSWADEK